MLPNRPQSLASLFCALLIFVVAIQPNGRAQAQITLVATGSSLPEPLYVAWGDKYHETHPAIQLRYLPEGTANSGLKIVSAVGDVGGGDAPIPDKELKDAAVPILQLPTVLIGIANDWLFPPTEVRNLAERMNAAYAEIATNHGHDGFLAHPELLGPLLVEVIG